MTKPVILSALVAVAASICSCVVAEDDGPGTDGRASSSGGDETGQGSSVPEESSSEASGEPSTSGPVTDGTSTTGGDPPATESGVVTSTTDPSTSGSDTNGAENVGCRHVCASDADCFFEGGVDTGLRCGETGYCIYACTEDADCLAQFASSAFMPCTSNAECALTGVCLDRGNGEGGCATITPDLTPCPEEVPAIDVVDIEGNPVTVCGQPDAYCGTLDDGAAACLFADTCAETGCPEGLTCAESGACICTADEDCLGFGDTCTDGGCSYSCESDAACEGITVFEMFEGGEIICEQG